MAVVTLGATAPLDMDQLALGPLFNGVTSDHSAGHIQIANQAGGITELFGNFTYDAGGQLTGGVVTELKVSQGGALLFDISNTWAPAAQLYQWGLRGDALDGFNALLAGADTFYASASNDLLRGYAGQSTFIAGGGRDVFIGGSGGANTVQFTGRFVDHSLTANADGSWGVQDLRSPAPDGAATLSNIQTLQFADWTIPLGPTPGAAALQEIDAAFTTLFRTSLAGAEALAATVVLADGSTAVNSVLEAARLTLPLASELQGGAPVAEAVMALIHEAVATTSVATLAYQFFTGAAPGASGMDYLISPEGPNSNSLNSPYYQSFSLTNRYINFAVNLGKSGAGAASFSAAYGGLSLADATSKAYAAIFGAAPTAAKVQSLLDPVVETINGQALTRADYFAGYGGDGANGLGTKAAMVGWLLAEAATADLGVYARSNDAYLTDVALHGAPIGVDLVGHYAQPGFVYTGG